MKRFEEKDQSLSVLFQEGANFVDLTNLDDVVQTFANYSVDCIVLCIGEEAYTETLGNIDDLSLSEPQAKLADELYETGVPIILVYLGRLYIYKGFRNV